MADISLEGWVPLSQAAPLRYLRMRAVEKNSAKRAKRFPLPLPATPPPMTSTSVKICGSRVARKGIRYRRSSKMPFMAELFAKFEVAWCSDAGAAEAVRLHKFFA